MAGHLIKNPTNKTLAQREYRKKKKEENQCLSKRMEQREL